jgi:hypothetical protein
MGAEQSITKLVADAATAGVAFSTRKAWWTSREDDWQTGKRGLPFII